MADYPLTKLEKALARRASSSASKPAWQELMERYDTVPSSKSVQAPDAITGFSGSWAASYDLGGSLRDMTVGESPAQIQRRTNLLGQPGMGEINFRPYDHGTNRHGKYGPSLLGHPISFQVVGPTAKTRGLVHQWFITEAGNVDTLNLDVGADINSKSITPSPLPAGADTIGEIYGFTAIPEGGLYIVVTMTGSEGVVTDNGAFAPGTDGGLGDGFIGEDDGGAPIGAGARLAVIPRTESVKYEIFRVTAMTPTTLVLDNAKRLSTYFDYNIGANAPVIRAITIIRPAATRLVAVPGSGSVQGGEQTFAFVPPVTALNADWQPVYASATGTGLFDPWTSAKNLDTNPAWGFAADAKDYGQAVVLPIPAPVNRGQGRLQGINGEAPQQLPLGRFRLILDAASYFGSTLDIGKIIRIYDIRRVLDGDWETIASAPATHRGRPLLDRMLGYFEIFNTGNADQGVGANNFYDLKFVSQVDPDTGVPFFGAGTNFVMATGSGAGQEVRFQWTVHEPISTLWTDRYLHPTRLDSARLKNLIDPRWVKPTLKGRELTDMAGHQAMPDRAIFDTSSSSAGVAGGNANPGNLLDLGFRVVLFPAKVIGAPTTSLVPDFDNPIDANEVVLDPTKLDENQFIEVDYSAGLVHLSHPPVVGSQLVPLAGILTADDNPRGEAVFFAACVPFSREPGQMGVNPRLTAGRSLDRAGSFCGLDSPEPVDVYGGRIFWPGDNQTINSGPQRTIQLNVELGPIDLPLTGFVDVLIGDHNPAGDPLFSNSDEERLCTFGYSTVNYNDVGHGGRTTLEGTFGGGDQTGPASYVVVPATTPVTVVLRKNIVLPNTLDGRTGTDYQFDTTYGYAKRPATLRFTHGDLTPEHDGSVSISTKDPRTDAHEALFSELFSSWCISGGINSTVLPSVGATLHFSEAVVLIQGIRTVMPEQDLVLGVVAGPPASRYVYIDGSTPACPVWASTTVLPLPTDNDVLMASYTHAGGNIQTLIDLRDPLVDIDKRLEVTVGNPSGHGQPGDAHFNELADAVAFVTETYRAFQVSGAPGEEGRARRIKVIGPTREDNAKLPISPAGLSGVIIEGAARTPDDTAANPLSITWEGAAAPPLFDLSDVSGWTFRDLAFRFVDSAASAVVPERCLFITRDGPTRNCIFENIYLLGKAHGFYYIDDTAVPGSAAYDNLLFRNCAATELTDFAIRVENNIDAANADVMKVEGCDFTVAKGAGRELNGTITDGGIVHVGTTNAERTSIRDSRLIGGNVGMFSAGVGNVIDGCLIQNTDLPAIWAKSDFWEINNNDIVAAHTVKGTSGPLNPAKVALYIDAGGAGQNEVHVINNRVDVSGGAAGDRAIFSDGNTFNCIFSGNSVDFDIMAATAVHILDNDIAVGDLSFDASCTVRGNAVVGDMIPLGTLANISNNNVAGLLLGILGTNCRYSNNNFLSSTATDHVVANGSSFNGDWFGDQASAGGRVELANDCTFIGCRFSDAVDGVTKLPSRNRFEACVFDMYATGFQVRGGSNSFLGNAFNDRTAGPVLNLEINIKGEGTVFSDNKCSIGTLSLEPEAGENQRFVVTGNQFFVPDINVGGMWIQGGYSVVSDNVVVGWESESADPDKFSIFVEGNQNVVNGNLCTKSLQVKGAQCTAVGNRVLINAVVALTDGKFDSNHVQGDVLIGGGAAASIQFNSNRIAGDVDYLTPATDSLISSSFNDNRIVGTTTLAVAAGVSIVDSTISGNRFGNDFAATQSDDCTFVGNRCTGSVNLTNSVGLVCNNNRIGKGGATKNLILTTCADYICNGNYVEGSILVDANTSGTGVGILVGNRAAVISSDNAPLAGQVAVGNRTTVNGVTPSLFNTNTGVVADIGVTVPSNLNTEV